MATVEPIPDHVPRELVVDLDIYDLPGAEGLSGISCLDGHNG